MVVTNPESLKQDIVCKKCFIPLMIITILMNNTGSFLTVYSCIHETSQFMLSLALQQL